MGNDTCLHCYLHVCLLLLVSHDIATSAPYSGCEINSVGKEHQCDCSGLALTDVPEHLPTYIRKLKLNNNNITHLSGESLGRYSNLTELDLSFNHINRIEPETFQRLKNLEVLRVLDISLNWLTFEEFNEELFMLNSNIKSLFLAGQFVPLVDQRFPSKVISSLTNLEHLSFSPHNKLPEGLSSLRKLRVLDLQWGIVTNLTTACLSPLANLTISEISFHNCKIAHIEDGIFNNFYKLRLVNFACNYDLDTDVAIDALSSSVNHSIDSLILDGTNINTLHGWRFGYKDRHKCRSILPGLTRLSVRATDVTRVMFNVSRCLSKVRQFSMGFNQPVQAHRVYLWTGFLLAFPRNILAIDASHLLAYNKFSDKKYLSCEKNFGVLPLMNMDYFPPIPAPRIMHRTMTANSSGMTRPFSAEVPVVPERSEGSRKRRTLPFKGSCLVFPKMFHSLQYIDLSYFSLLQNSPDAPCAYMGMSSVRFLNLSHCIQCAKRIVGPFYELDNLEVVDLSSWGFTYIDSNWVVNAPNIHTIILKDNNLGSGQLEPFPEAQNLRELYLQGNGIASIPHSMFANLENLTVLELGDNSLSKLDFLSSHMRRLKRVDVSGNKLAYIPGNITNILDDISSEESPLVLNLHDNGLRCSCVEIDFIHWIQTTNVIIWNSDNLKCLDGLDQHNINDIDLTEMKHRCQKLSMIISASIIVPAAVIAFIVACYRYRWNIKWKYVVLKKMFQSARIGRHGTNACVIYPAAYPNVDQFCSTWITGYDSYEYFLYLIYIYAYII